MSEASPSQRRLFWTVVLGGGAVLLACGAAYFAGQVGDADWWRREATAYNLRHAVPDEDNAALDYERLTGARYTGTTDFRVDWRTPLSTSDLLLLAGMDAALDNLTALTRKPHCIYRLPPETLPFNVPMAYLQRIQNLGRHWLPLRARKRASEGHAEEAGEDLLTAIRMGAQQDRGFQIHRLVGMACRYYACQGLERLAMDAPPAAEVLERWMEEIQAVEAGHPQTEEAWEVERLSARGTLEAVYRPGTLLSSFRGGDPRILEGTLGWFYLSVKQPLRRCRRDCEELMDLKSKENPTKADLARMDAITENDSVVFPFGEGRKFMHSFRKTQALERGTRILLQLRAKRLREGAYPATLDGLEAPTDPYSGKPFIYRKLEGDAFQLYAVGPNGVDDGGKRDLRDPGGSMPNAGVDLIFGRPPTP